MGLYFLFVLALVVFLGLLVTRFSERQRWPPALLLLLLGAFLGGLEGVSLDSSWWLALAVVSVSLAVFDGVARWNFNRWSSPARGLACRFLWIALVMVGVFAWGLLARFATSTQALGLVLIFVFLVLGFEVGSRHRPSALNSLLAEEASWLSPLALIIPFLAAGFMSSSMALVRSGGFALHPFIQAALIGLGVGLVVGIVFFKVLRRGFSWHWSPAWLFAAILLSFLLAELLGGSGVLSVATIGILFGHSFIAGKGVLQEFNRSFSEVLTILVLVLVGVALKISLSTSFLVNGVVLFLALFFARHVAVQSWHISHEEKTMVTSFLPKGFYSGAALLGLAVLGPDSLLPWLQVAWLVMVLSLVLSVGSWRKLTNF